MLALRRRASTSTNDELELAAAVDDQNHRHRRARSAEMPPPPARLPPVLAAAMAESRNNRLPQRAPAGGTTKKFSPLAEEAFTRTPAASTEPRLVSEAMERMRSRVATSGGRMAGDGGGGRPAGGAMVPLRQPAPPPQKRQPQSTTPLRGGPPPPPRVTNGGVRTVPQTARRPQQQRPLPSTPQRRVTVSGPRPAAHRPSFDRRALFALTKFRPRPIDEQAPAPVVGPQGYQGGFESDVVSKQSKSATRRHSWSSTRDFSEGTPGSDMFDKFGWNSGDSSSAGSSAPPDAAMAMVIHQSKLDQSGGSGGDSSGAQAVVTRCRAPPPTAAPGPRYPGANPRAVVDRAKLMRRHSSDSLLSGGASVRFTPPSSSPSPRQQERTVREKRKEVFAKSQRFKTDRIHELQDENMELKTQNETLEARVAEAQEKAVDFVVKVLQSKGLLEMGELQGIMAAGIGEKQPQQEQQLQTLPEKTPPPATQDEPPKANRRKSIETVSSSVASMIWKSGMISRDSRISAGPDSESEPGSVRALRERCRQLRADRNQRHEEAQSAQREAKALATEVEGLQRDLIDALDGAELAEKRKKCMDEMERELENSREEVRIKEIELEAKCEELELADEDLQALKDEMESSKFGSGKSSLLTGIDVPSYGTPSMCRTDTAKSNDTSAFMETDDESVRADILRQMEEMIHQRDMALLTAKGDLKKGADRIVRLEDELNRARQEVVAARAAVGIYRAEMEEEIERTDTEARALLREARWEVRQLGEMLDEREAAVKRLELVLETAREDVEDLKEELKIEKAITGNGSLGYPISEDELSAKFGGGGDGMGLRAEEISAARLKFGGGMQGEDDLLSVLVKVQIENHQLKERLGIPSDL